MNEQAEKLNEILLKEAPNIYFLLSSVGRKIFFPSQGIVAQSAEAKKTKINATIGQALEDDCSPMVLESMSKHVNIPTDQTFLYSPSHGQKSLREKWKEGILEKNHIKSEISLPIVTNGITNGLNLAKTLFVNNSDQVILPDKFWGNYKLIFRETNLSTFPTFENNRFNVEGLEQKLLSKGNKKIVLLNFPNNPTGYSPTEKEADQIAKSLQKATSKGKNITALCDDAYFGLTYEQGIYQKSMFSKLANLNEKILAVKLDGITKEMFSWGLRIGFITYGTKGMNKKVSQVLEDKTAGLIRGETSNSCTHSQFLALKGLNSPDFKDQIGTNYKKLKERYSIVKDVLNSNPHYPEFFRPFPFNSGYFMCVGLKKNNGNAIRKKLIKDYSTGIISIKDTLRIAYSSVPTAKIPAIFENIYKACQESSQNI